MRRIFMTCVYQQLPFNYVLRTLYKMLLMYYCQWPRLPHLIRHLPDLGVGGKDREYYLLWIYV